MNDTSIANLRDLAVVDADLSKRLASGDPLNLYATTVLAKDGNPVPVFVSGDMANSTYNPIREGCQLASEAKEAGFVVFGGIAGAYHIRSWLKLPQARRCIIVESSLEALRAIFGLIDLRDIIADARVTLRALGDEVDLESQISSAYLPALHGRLAIVCVRSWENQCGRESEAIRAAVSRALIAVSADYSVQSHFGKIWMRNALMNLRLLRAGQGQLPSRGGKQWAFIAAAGPSLEDALEPVRRHREACCVIATDTAYGALLGLGITADVFVSIDAQNVSHRHVMRGLDASTTIVLDLCGNPEIALAGRRAGCNVIIAAGGHPLAALADTFGALPHIDTGSGTVTIAAIGIATSLGFSDIRLGGADFCYRGGKPYARGTYLADTYDSIASRIEPAEGLYTALLFRSEVRRVERAPTNLDYHTAVMDRYAEAARGFVGKGRWAQHDFDPFPVQPFCDALRDSLQSLAQAEASESHPALFAVLPLIAWYMRQYPKLSPAEARLCSINLALDLIARYTERS
jgi:hypothetical protein